MSTASATKAVSERPLLFDGVDVRVKDARLFGSPVVFVTFTSWTDDMSLDREGFAEGFLRGEGIDGIHVISRDNRWWQYAETLPAMAAVRSAATAYARAVTYGSSMGAYAAVRLAGQAGADAVLAMSPQFSILPRVAAFEHRWMPISRTLQPVWELGMGPPRPTEAYLVYDPHDLDACHVDLFAHWGLRFTPVRLRGAGHQTTDFLQEVDLLKALVREVAAGPLDVDALEREAWLRRRSSAQHVLTLVERTHAPELKLALTRRALGLAPDSPVLHGRLGEALVQAGRPQEALASHVRALELAPGWAPLLISQARAMVAAGQRDEAHGLLETLARRTGDPVHAWAAADLDPRRKRGPRAGLWRAERRYLGMRPPVGAQIIDVAADEAGCVLGGPNVLLRGGRYAVSFGVAAAVGPPRPLKDWAPAASVDVSLSSGPRLVRRVLSTRALRRAAGTVTLEFVLHDRAVCEFRVHARGGTALRIDPRRSCRRIGPAG